MSVTSDPHLASVSTPLRDEWQQHERHHVIDPAPIVHERVVRARRGWQYMGLVVAAVAVWYAASQGDLSTCCQASEPTGEGFRM